MHLVNISLFYKCELLFIYPDLQKSKYDIETLSAFTSRKNLCQKNIKVWIVAQRDNGEDFPPQDMPPGSCYGQG